MRILLVSQMYPSAGDPDLGAFVALVERELLALSAELEPGDSGSAVLRDDGSVIGVAVAVAPDRPLVAYALDTTELASLGSSTQVGTGPCIR